MRIPRRPRLLRLLSALLFAVSSLAVGHPSALATPARLDRDASVQAASQQPPLRPVRVSPDRGVVGAPFTVSVDGLASGQVVEWQWLTWDGWYSTNPTSETVEYRRREFTD